MKVKKLHIESHKHLKDLNLDFTYPKGHKLEGQPLKRVCIIGQSATGKTTILDVLNNNLKYLYNSNFGDTYFITNPRYNLIGEGEYLSSTGLPLKTRENEIIQGQQKYRIIQAGDSIEDADRRERVKLIYLGAGAINHKSVQIFNKNPIDLLTEVANAKSKFSEFINEQLEDYIFEFSEGQDINIWFTLFTEILEYRKKFTQTASELVNKGIGNPEKFMDEFNRWAKSNPNPIASIAAKFNPILERLNLEVDTINTQYPVAIKPKFSDQVVPISDLSTGTKGLLLSFFPLLQLDTKDAIILVDEPERSLFPDIQVELISHYERLAPEAQLIVATHSPFIAAAFEPYERFILYFDENGNVAVRNGQSPIGDDPNDILKNDFQVDYYNAAGQKAYKDYLALKQKMSQETDIQKKKALLLELNHLGNQYNF